MESPSFSLLDDDDDDHYDEREGGKEFGESERTTRAYITR